MIDPSLPRGARALDEAPRHPVRTGAQGAEQRAVHDPAKLQQFVAERRPLPGRQRHQARAVGLAEVVHEDAVGDCPAHRLDVAQQHLDDRGPTGPHQPRDEQVVALRLDPICTAYAFIASVYLLKYISPFSMVLTYNLEPIYGIILAVCIFGSNEIMTFEFYIGFFLILSSILINMYFKRNNYK